MTFTTTRTRSPSLEAAPKDALVALGRGLVQSDQRNPND